MFPSSCVSNAGVCELLKVGVEKVEVEVIQLCMFASWGVASWSMAWSAAGVCMVLADSISGVCWLLWSEWAGRLDSPGRGCRYLASVLTDGSVFSDAWGLSFDPALSDPDLDRGAIGLRFMGLLRTCRSRRIFGDAFVSLVLLRRLHIWKCCSTRLVASLRLVDCTASRTVSGFISSSEDGCGGGVISFLLSWVLAAAAGDVASFLVEGVGIAEVFKLLLEIIGLIALSGGVLELIGPMGGLIIPRGPIIMGLGPPMPIDPPMGIGPGIIGPPMKFPPMGMPPIMPFMLGPMPFIVFIMPICPPPMPILPWPPHAHCASPHP
eukprot:comp23749_c0_seq1/m.41024 comp23749_c0_seq1/g.41024  ORF comp23749_c0_seq1/g.41024 comp23749_c0_seq1/m.41024 type:complete len:322 (+) comp23749_c0_seq1:441-1406(+)